MKTEYILVILLLVIVLLVVTNKKQEMFCKIPGTQLVPDVSGNYNVHMCCSKKIINENNQTKCSCIQSGENIHNELYDISVTAEDCCSHKVDASGNCI